MDNAQIHKPFVVKPLTRFAHIENLEHICVGLEVDDRHMLKRLADDEKHFVKKHVSVGPVDGDYDDHDKPVCSLLRNVFQILLIAYIRKIAYRRML